MKKTDKQRFWTKINKDGPLVLESPCWIWIGAKDRYGRFWCEGKNIPSHRLSYELHKGPIPRGLCVCHRCDTPRCVNPDHLFAGTHLENRQDCVKKGRSARGETNGYAKLTEKQIIEIRSKPIFHGSGAAIAREFNISKTNVADIINRKRWKHL